MFCGSEKGNWLLGDFLLRLAIRFMSFFFFSIFQIGFEFCVCLPIEKSDSCFLNLNGLMGDYFRCVGIITEVGFDLW